MDDPDIYFSSNERPRGALEDGEYRMLGDTQPEHLRDDLELRSRMAGQLAAVQEKAAAMMSDLPTRAISLEDDE